MLLTCSSWSLARFGARPLARVAGNGCAASLLLPTKRLPITLHTSKRVLSHFAGYDGGSNKEVVDALKHVVDALKEHNELSKSNQEVLKSIDSRLGRIEQQGLGGSNRRGQKPRESKVVNVEWKFIEPDKDLGWGQVTEGGKELLGVSRWSSFGKPSRAIGVDGTPQWYSTEEERYSLSRLAFNESLNIPLKSGMYSLKVKYSATQRPTENPEQEAGFIVGEVEFNNGGFVHAKGADWDKLLNGQKQTQLPYSHGARGEATWRKHKICEPWEDGMELKFRIDTGTNTIIFQKADSPEVMLRNVLAFTNNPQYPEFLQVFAYCIDDNNRQEDEKPGVKLEIIES